MSKVFIYSIDDNFKKDLESQIKKHLKGIEVLNSLDESCQLLLIDEDTDFAKNNLSSDNNIPAVFFTANNKSLEKADLVIKKPFLLHEFLQLLQENELLPKIRRNECLSFLEYNLYPNKKEITSAKTADTVKLTEKEVDILKYLYDSSSDIITKEELLKNVWGYNIDVTTHTIETHIYRLRQKVEKDNGSQIIITKNSGYYLNR